MKKYIKYFIITISVFSIISITLLTKIIYSNIININNIQINYKNILNENDEYLINISYKNPKTNLYCSKDTKN